jgi:hypothetical protein
LKIRVHLRSRWISIGKLRFCPQTANCESRIRKIHPRHQVRINSSFSAGSNSTRLGKSARSVNRILETLRAQCSNNSREIGNAQKSSDASKHFGPPPLPPPRRTSRSDSARFSISSLSVFNQLEFAFRAAMGRCRASVWYPITRYCGKRAEHAK